MGKEQYEMKHLRIAFGLVVMAGLMVIAAAPAMAANARWEQCKTVALEKTGNWSDDLCSKPVEKGAWLTMELAATETEEVTSKSIGKIELTDTKAPGGASTVACEGTDRGTIGALGNDQEIEVFAEKCVRITGACEAPVRVKAVNLPWITQLEEALPIGSARLRDTVRSEVAGKSPGYDVECSLGGLFILEDECVGPISVEISNMANGNVLTEFDKVSEEEQEKSSKCEKGKAGAGRVKGLVEIQQRKAVATYVKLR